MPRQALEPWIKRQVQRKRRAPRIQLRGHLGEGTRRSFGKWWSWSPCCVLSRFLCIARVASLGLRSQIRIRYFPAAHLARRRSTGGEFRFDYSSAFQHSFQAPDPWLAHQNPWELPRIDVVYDVRFYGHAERLEDGTGRALWHGGQEVLAMAYDVMIPGYGTQSTNNLRLWESKPKRGFDLNSFNGAWFIDYPPKL